MIALTCSFGMSQAGMVREEFLEHAERNMPRIPGSFYPLSSAEPSPPPSPPRDGKPRPRISAGCLVANFEELKLWIVNNLPTMIEQGKRFNANVYKEIRRILKEDHPERRITVAIIPVDDHDDMRRLVNLFFATTEELKCPVVRVRTLFDGVQVLIGDWNENQ